MPTILLLNGPNLNLLGIREPGIYGNNTLDDIVKQLTMQANKASMQLEHLQSNAEHILLERIHQAQTTNVAFILFNPAAFTHTSVALRDALLAVKIPFIEIHLSNIYGRETFRHKSYFSDIAQGVISGFGIQSYTLALNAAINFLTHS